MILYLWEKAIHAAYDGLFRFIRNINGVRFLWCTLLQNPSCSPNKRLTAFDSERVSSAQIPFCWYIPSKFQKPLLLLAFPEMAAILCMYGLYRWRRPWSSEEISNRLYQERACIIRREHASSEESILHQRRAYIIDDRSTSTVGPNEMKGPEKRREKENDDGARFDEFLSYSSVRLN